MTRLWSLVAWDQWDENPARAAGLLGFNAVTTVATLGTGTAVRGTGTAASAAVRAANAAARVGNFLDPTTHIARGVGAGVRTLNGLRVGDITSGLADLNALEVARLPDGTFRAPDGTTFPAHPSLDDLPAGVTALRTPEGIVIPRNVEAGIPGAILDPDTGVLLAPDGSLRAPDGSVIQHADDAPTDIVNRPSPAEHPASPLPDPELVGAAARHQAGGLTGHLDDVPGTGLRPGEATARLDDDLQGTTGRPGDGPGGGPSNTIDDLGNGGRPSGDPGVGYPGSTAVTGHTNPPGGDPPTPNGSGPDTPTAPEPPPGHKPGASNEDIAARASNEEDFRKRYWYRDGRRLSVAHAIDEYGNRLPQLIEDPNNPGRYLAKSELPPPKPVRYLYVDPIMGHRSALSPAVVSELDRSAAVRQAAIDDLNAARRELNEALHEHRIRPTEETAARVARAKSAVDGLVSPMTKSSERFGEFVAERHAIPEHYPNARRVDDGRGGPRRFDQIWIDDESGRIIVVEAKGSTTADLVTRKSNKSNELVKQGTRDYFEAIIYDMKKRAYRNSDNAELSLAAQLDAALKNDLIDYVEVRARSDNAGRYAGYVMRHYDIRRAAE